MQISTKDNLILKTFNIIFSTEEELNFNDQETLKRIFITLINDNNDVDIPYHEIMKQVYSMNNDKVLKCNKNLDKKVKFIQNNIVEELIINHPNSKIHSFLHELIIDIETIIIEKHNLDKSIKANENRFDKSLKQSRKRSRIEFKQSLNDSKIGVYTNLITILGIFVAIMAAIFGGLQLFSNLFKDSYKLGFGKSISLGSILLFGIYFIILIAFNGIYKIIYNKPYQVSKIFSSILILILIGLFLLGYIVLS